MTYSKFTSASLFIAGTLFFTGCGAVPDLGEQTMSGNDFVYRGHDFGSNRDAEYRQGVKDGCTTSDGDYKKNHALFNDNLSYHDGWEHGRLHCTGKK